MRLVKPRFEVLGPIFCDSLLSAIERAGRTCYKSESKITPESAKKFVAGLIQRGHESVLEHQSVSVWAICDRGVSHEIVRHRLASYSQESTRYCNYKGGVTFVIPPWVTVEPGDYDLERMAEVCERLCLSNQHDQSIWVSSMKQVEEWYLALLSRGWQPQQARSVLPNSLKTEIVMTMNLREWRHFFRLRAVGVAGHPHPQMLELAAPMLDNFKQIIPVVFDDLKAEHQPSAKEEHRG